MTTVDLRERAFATAHKRYNACLAPRDTSYDHADAMHEAVSAALDFVEEHGTTELEDCMSHLRQLLKASDPFVDENEASPREELTGLWVDRFSRLTRARNEAQTLLDDLEAR